MTKRTSRNLILVALLFLLIIAGIVAARLRHPYVPYEEPPDLVAKRLDKENNAFYALEEASALLPPPPPEIGYVKDETGFESKFRAQPGSVGHLIFVRRPDDDPLLLDYVAKAKPAVDRARVVLEQKPFFYFPPVDWSLPLQQRHALMVRLYNVQRLHPLLVLDSASKSCSQSPDEDACRLMRQALDFSFKINADECQWYDSAESFAVDVIRKARPEHQSEIMKWLDDTRQNWTPPRAGIEYMIRFTREAKWEDNPNQGSRGRGFGDRIEFSRAQLFVRRHEDLYREAAKLTCHEYRQQSEKFEPLNNAPKGQFNILLHAEPISTNSRFFARVDGLRIAIALESYHRDHGAYPDSLAALAPTYLADLPKSPYDGKDFEYGRQGDDYRLVCRVVYVTSWTGSRGAKVILHAPASTDKAP